MNTTERKVQRTIFIGGSSTYQLMLPNYTPHNWWECDVFGVTRAGYFHEYEIKNTVSDFRADANKRDRDTYKPLDPTVKTIGYRDRKDPTKVKLVRGRSKYARLAAGEEVAPSRFWYVMPKDLVDPSEIPKWAGLKWFTPFEGHPLVHIQIAKPAPRIHKKKVSEAITTHALGVCYHRFWQERQRSDEAQAKLEAMRGVA